MYIEAWEVAYSGDVKEREKELAKKGKPIPFPSPAELRAEAEEEPPAILLSVADAGGSVLRLLTGPVAKGFHRLTWDLREPAPSLPRPMPPERDQDLFFEPPAGPLVEPGPYQITWAKRVRGKVTPLPGSEKFKVTMESTAERSDAEHDELFTFQQKVTRLQRAVEGALEAANNLNAHLQQIKQALDQTPTVDVKWKAAARKLEQQNRDILRTLRGDEVLRSRNENTPPAIVERVRTIVESQRLSLGKPTTTQRQQYQVASEEFAQTLGKLRRLLDVDLKKLDRALDKAGAPWTPGRLPEWKVEKRKLQTGSN